MIRFNRSSAVREVYAIYDRGEYDNVIRACTARLGEPNADPELRLLRGVALLDKGKPNEAVADWEICCGDAHLAGVAHYYLGNFLSTQLEAFQSLAWEQYSRAIACGWVEGHIGRGSMLLDRGLRAKEDGRSEDASQHFRDAVLELTTGLTSPAPASQRRALSIRGDAYFHLGETAARAEDRAAEKRLSAAQGAVQTDPRATGGDQYS
jgi:hypothetical protein